MFFSILLMLRATPGHCPKGIIRIRISLLALSSVDLPLFGPGFPPDKSLEGYDRNRAVIKSVQEGTIGGLTAIYKTYLKELGAE